MNVSLSVSLLLLLVEFVEFREDLLFVFGECVSVVLFIQFDDDGGGGETTALMRSEREKEMFQLHEEVDTELIREREAAILQIEVMGCKHREKIDTDR